MNFIAFLKKYKPQLIGVLLIIVLILVGKFISTVDFEQLSNYLTQMPEMFVGVLVVSFSAYLSATIAWHLLMGEARKKVRFVDLFMIKHVGEMLTIFNPTGIIAGEGIKAIYLQKRGIDSRHGLSSIIMLRILTMLSGIFLTVISGVYLILVKLGDSSKLLYIIIAVALIVFLSYLLTVFLLNPKLYFGRMVEKLQKKKGWSFLTDKIVASSYEINKISSDFFAANKIRFTSSFILCITHWIFGALEFYIILRILGLNPSLIDVVAVEMGIIFFKTIGAIIPGQIGIEEYGNKVMLDAIGVQSNEVWLVATLMRRGRQVFWLAVAGIFMLFISNTTQIKLKENDGNSLHNS